MAKFKFTGTYTGGRSSITICGVTFNGHDPSEVKDEAVAATFENHPEFAKVGGRAKADDPAGATDAKQADAA